MIEISNKTRSRIDKALVSKIASGFLKKYKRAGQEVSIVFIGDKKMRELNKQYRNCDAVTDVLSFMETDDMDPGHRGGVKFLGEVVIDYAQIKRQAKKYSNTNKDELVFILVHGLLHLLGYEDESETGRREMEKLGNKIVKQIKVK